MAVWACSTVSKSTNPCWNLLGPVAPFLGFNLMLIMLPIGAKTLRTSSSVHSVGMLFTNRFDSKNFFMFYWIGALLLSVVMSFSRLATCGHTSKKFPSLIYFLFIFAIAFWALWVSAKQTNPLFCIVSTLSACCTKAEVISPKATNIYSSYFTSVSRGRPCTKMLLNVFWEVSFLGLVRFWWRNTSNFFS